MSRPRSPPAAERLLTLVAREAGSAPSLVARHDELERLARGVVLRDPAAIRTFLRTIGPPMLRVVRRVLGAAHPDVEDVVQECAVAVIESLPRYRGESTVLHFCCRVAVLTSMNARRREAAQKRPTARDDEVGLDELASSFPWPDAELSARLSLRAVRELLATLPLAQAEVLAMHCVLGFTVAEIAQVSEVPLETVRSRLRLSRQALRARVKTYPALCEVDEERS